MGRGEDTDRRSRIISKAQTMYFQTEGPAHSITFDYRAN